MENSIFSKKPESTPEVSGLLKTPDECVGGRRESQTPEICGAGAPARGEPTLSIPIVKSFHSRISYLDFSWHTSLSIESCWGPWEALRGPLGGPPVPEKGKQNASNHQISLCPPLKWVMVSIPIVKSSRSRISYLYFSWHNSSSIDNHWGPMGALRGPFSAWKWQTLSPKTTTIIQYLAFERP